MATGFLAYREDGTLMVDMTENFSQMQGSFVTGSANGSGTMASLPPGKTRFYMITSLVDRNAWLGKRPGVSISGNVMSWVYSYNTNNWGFFSANCRIYYGYY